jgi:putative exosortase-associated protein (TIGR04073 family)
MKYLTSLLLVLVTLSMAQADLTMPKKPNFYDKLGHGIANIILAPAHILDSTYELTLTEGPTVGTTKGLVQGTSRMVMDMFIGVAEVFTSPFPGKSYKSPAYDSGLVEAYPPADLIENWY